MTTMSPMREALDAILADEKFARSPVLARLLAYLGETTFSGSSRALKSYAVAIDGLGRDPDEGPQIETYARVQVGRLRKALEAYYAGSGSHHEQRLLIDNGSYEVRLVPRNEPASDSRRIFAPLALPRWSLRTVGAAVVAVALAALLVVAWMQFSQAQETQQWRTGNFPTISATISSVPGEVGAVSAEHIRRALLMKLEVYEGIRVNYGSGAPSDYLVSLNLEPEGAARELTMIVTHRKSNRMIWSAGSPIPRASEQSESILSADLANWAFLLAQPTGIIHANERRQRYSLETPYGCWLGFTGALQNENMFRDPKLEGCAREWYAAAPNHPGAAAIRGWHLTDEAVLSLTERGFRSGLRDAIGRMERTRMNNPDSPLLQLALMRAYAFAGDRAGALRSGATALRLNPENLDVRGMVGLFMILQGEPRGEALIDDALSRHFNPPPWYHTGKFVSAMMRDDHASARLALNGFGPMQNSKWVVPILSAAVDAREGNLKRARATWGQAQNREPILRLSPHTYLGRLPLSPGVRHRLKSWLGPLLD